MEPLREKDVAITSGRMQDDIKQLRARYEETTLRRGTTMGVHKWLLVHKPIGDQAAKVELVTNEGAETAGNTGEVLECYIDCEEEVAWEIKVNNTKCGGVKTLTTGSRMEIHIFLEHKKDTC